MAKKLTFVLVLAALAAWCFAQTANLTLLEKYKTLLGTMDKARSAFDKGNGTACERELDRCLKAVPDHHEAHYFKAQMRYKEGDFVKALDHMTAAENGYAHFLDVLEEAKVNQMMKDVDKEQALADLIPALEKALDQSVCKPPTYMAAITDAKNKLDETKNEKPDALRKEKAAVPAEYQYFRGNCLYRLKRYEEAEFHYRGALEADPAHANATNNLLNLLYGQKRYADALAVLERADLLKVPVQEGLKKAVLDAAKK